MQVYLANIILLIVGYFLYQQIASPKKANFLLCVQATTQWILISGLRSTRVGADTYRYSLLFDQAMYTPWSEVFTNFRIYLTGTSELKDYGYIIFQKLIQFFTSDYHVFLLIVAAIIFIPMGIWIYRNSSNALTSYILFSCLFYSFFAITGLRQSIVTSLCIFLGEPLLKKKKYIRYIILVLVSSLVHKSALIMLVYLLIYPKKKISNAYLFGSGIAILLCWAFKSRLMAFASGLIGYEQYAEQMEGTGAYTFTLLYMLIFFVVFLVKNKLLMINPDAYVYINALIVGACLLPLVSINQSAMRAVQYFSIYLMLLLPLILDSLTSKKERFIPYLVCNALMILLLIGNSPNYTFFWQV